jgi:isochorismate pyruvate lyase
MIGLLSCLFLDDWLMQPIFCRYYVSTNSNLARFFVRCCSKTVTARHCHALNLKARTMSADLNPSMISDPAVCESMAEVRVGVDAVDRELVALLARRFGYMDAAARIKADRSTVRDEARKADVIANVRRAALELRIPQDVVVQIWETLVEGSIAYEFERWDSLHR